MSDTLEAELDSALRDAFPDGRIAVQLDGDRALIEVQSSAFTGLSRVRQQQAVYGAIGRFVSDGRLHAVTLRTSTPDG